MIKFTLKILNFLKELDLDEENEVVALLASVIEEVVEESAPVDLSAIE
jgi:hypothetical protein